MPGGVQVYLSTRLFSRVSKWGTEEQVHICALKDSFADHEILEVLSGFQCSIGGLFLRDDEQIERVEFWIRMRGAYVALTLRIVQPNVGILDSP